MPIHEKSLIRPENITTHDDLVIEGVDVSGHWSTFIETRVIADYNEAMEEEIAALPGGENIHRCWQCGSCTNSCTVHAIEPRFNPRYWIYLIRTGMESELLRDKDLIWQCVSCNKCTYACPRDVVPEGVMKATAHWLEMKGHVPESPSMIFDKIFTEQIVEHGRIEDTKVLMQFLKRTNQPLMQDWLKQIVMNIAARLPVKWGLKSAWSFVFHPRTRGWKKAGAALQDYIIEVEQHHKAALGAGTSNAASNDNPPQRKLHAAE
ncbi:MAG: 4Fe-4S dicluster domain-containing protein [Alphaproteobacteria bacterium]|nr:4Fe-4S dicluster domain-containing protein [Alphaproteobacteria bacterium]